MSLYTQEFNKKGGACRENLLANELNHPKSFGNYFSIQNQDTAAK